MGNSKFTLVALVLLFFSCELEDDGQNLIGIEENANDIAVSNVVTTAETRQLKENMQWAAFMTAKTLLLNPEARVEFKAQLASSDSRTISLASIIGDQVPDTAPFKKAFKETVLEYVLDPYRYCRTEGAEDTPPPPINVTSGTIEAVSENLGLDDSQTMVNEFISYLVDQNCLEFFLPKGLKDNFVQIASSAHPLTNAQQNTGYIRNIRPVFSDGRNCNEDFYTDEFSIGLIYLANSNDPVIVIRPEVKRNGGCDYSMYPVNFGKFLNP